ncbi:MAG: 3-deoxy-D-manno-oct-2-ulosonic acid (Kdo) hydroxylase family protein [Ramlibacter sp.]|nr:3-deoxy-D-manno-oct-2-ulosonic acid (Kdo) hydroxylase family protein [Ramlibacter sp.]
MTDIITLPTASWNQPVPTADRELAIDVLERGGVLLFPQLEFPVLPGEALLLSPEVAGKTKNVSLNPSTGALRGSSVNDAALQQLRNMMSRFATSSRDLLRNVVPRYETGLEQARTSFRPAEIRGRHTSPRKDDTRLHVDSFPSSPTQGDRILRVFANINPHGSTRNWKLGESFEDVARRFLPSISGPVWGSDRMLRLLRITKRRRTAYDHYMLQLHDRMKADSAYQSQVAQSAYDFPAGCTWMTFTDQVSHAAIAGQYALEQTYHLPVNSMLDPSRAPLRILETLLGRELT